MTPLARQYLAHSPAARAVLGVLRWCDLSAPQLARVLAGRFATGTIRRAVLELRRLGEVRASGRWSRWPGRAREWRAAR